MVPPPPNKKISIFICFQSTSIAVAIAGPGLIQSNLVPPSIYMYATLKNDLCSPVGGGGGINKVTSTHTHTHKAHIHRTKGHDCY